MASLQELEAEFSRRQQPEQKSTTQPMANLQELEAEAARRSQAKIADQPQKPVTVGDVGAAGAGLGMEAITGVNRGVAKLLDFFTIDQINNVRSLMGDDAIPTLEQALVGPKGQFTQGTIAEGLPTDIAAGAGEMAVAGFAGQGLIKQGAKQLAPMAANTGSRVLSQAAQPSLASATGFGAASGAGEEVGRDLGGETGALVGAVAAPIAGLAAVGGAKALVSKLATKFGPNISLINAETGLPSQELQKALQKRGLEFGSIVDDIEKLPVISSKKSASDVVEMITRRKLLDNATDDGLAILRLEGNSIVPDKLGEEAIKQGYRAGDVSAAKAMTGRTKIDALDMLKKTRQIKSNSSLVQEFRPTDVVGKNVLERFNYIKDKASSLKTELDKIANMPSANKNALSGPGVTKGLKGQEINTMEIEDTLLAGLKKLEVSIPDDILKDTRLLNSYLKTNDAFTGSLISENPSSKNIIRKSIKLLSEPGTTDASRAHSLKRQLDELIDFNKAGKQGLTESGRTFAKSLRRALNNTIREINPQYGVVNDKLSASIESMQGFQKALGPSIDIFKPGASKAIGQDLKGLLSVRKTRVKLENAINSLEDTSKSLGGSFESDVKQLVQFANTLDRRHGAIADASLKGELGGIVQQAFRGKAGVLDLAAQKLAEGAEKLQGINDENAFNAIQKILKR
jgi:hypothetical protein